MGTLKRITTKIKGTKWTANIIYSHSKKVYLNALQKSLLLKTNNQWQRANYYPGLIIKESIRMATINTYSSRQANITELHLKLMTATCAAHMFSDLTCASGA